MHPQSNAPQRAAIYVRVSSKGQEDDGTSLDTQEARCRAYCADHGYAVVEVFSDTHTGSQYRERPALSRLRTLVRSGGVDVVVSYALDRLSRNQAHLAILVEEIEDYGARLELVTEAFEDTAVGRFVRSARAFAAEVEREKLVERTSRGKRARAESGKPLVGTRPRYGLRWRDEEKSAYDIDPITAPIVRRVFRGFADGISLRKLAMTLNAEGIATPSTRSEAWSHSSVRNLLVDPIYTGAATAFRWESYRTANGKKSNRQRPLDEQVVLPAGTVPPLVDAETFAAVQRRLVVNKHRLVRDSPRKEEALLRGGFVRCGYCGCAMTAVPTNRGNVIYVCKRGGSSGRPCGGHGITASILDAAVWSKVEETLNDPDIIAAKLVRLNADDPTERDLAAVDRSIAEVEHRRARLARRIAVIDDDEEAAPLMAIMQSDAAVLRQLAEERAAVLAAQRSRTLAVDRLSRLGDWCRTVAARLDGSDWEHRRLALDALAVSVRVFRKDAPDRYLITLLVPLDEDELDTTSSGCEHLTLRWSDRDDALIAAD